MLDKPMLRFLHHNRIFSVGLLQNGEVGFVEECDQHFSVELSAAGLSKLIAELEAVLAEMSARETKET